MGGGPTLTVVNPLPQGHIFVSYSHNDEDEVGREIAFLKDKGFEVWHDSGNIPAGADWNEEIAKAIESCAVLLFFGSSSSVGSSVCLNEINLALSMGKPIQVVIIEEFRIPPRLQLMIGTKQYIKKTGQGQANYEQMLVRALSNHQFKINDGIGAPIREAQEKRNRNRIFGMGAAILMLLAIIGTLLYDRFSLPAGDPQSIAVLPLEDLTQEGDQEYLGDGISEALINGLFAVEGLQITPRSRAFRYKDSELDVLEVGNELGVDTVLEGTIRRSGEQLRITTTLIDVRTGFQLWTQNYTRSAGSLFELQDEITAAVVVELSTRLGEPAATGTMYGTTNVEAYDNYLKGIFLKDGSLEELETAITFLRRAIELDDRFAHPYGELATKLILMHDLFKPEDKALIAEARALLATAETLDSRGDPYITINARWHLALREWDWPAAEQVIRQALIYRESGEYEQNPFVEELPLERMYADLLGAAGHYDASNRYYEQAETRFEFDQTMAWGLAQNHIALGDHEQALDVIDRALLMWPNLEYMLLLRGKVEAMQGRVEAAETTLDALIDSGAIQSAQHLQIFSAAKSGDGEWAQTLLASEAELGSFPSDLYLIAGDLDQGFPLMQKYLTEDRTYSGQVWILNRFFDGYLESDVLSDERYVELTSSLGLTREWRGTICSRAADLGAVTGISAGCD